jgi:aryl-alcohol dehydrogenase-like predicted oxidoreductase
VRFLGRTGVKVSRVALGTMSFGGDADEHTAWTIWRAARDAGINFIDTADVYNDGRSEEMLGRFMQSDRDQVVLATKAYFPVGKDVNARGASRYHLVRAVEASLRRLQTDRIDVYYLHRFDDATALDESLRGLDDLVRAGKILYPACSNFAAWQVAHALGIQAARNWAPLVALQPMYNLVKRTAEIELLPMAHALGVAVVPYSPTSGRPAHRQVRREPSPRARPAPRQQDVRDPLRGSGDVRDRRCLHGEGGRARPPAGDPRRGVGRLASGGDERARRRPKRRTAGSRFRGEPAVPRSGHACHPQRAVARTPSRHRSQRGDQRAQLRCALNLRLITSRS